MELNSLSTLRVLVAHLAETASDPWWSTQFTTEAGLEFMRQSFPRTWAAAAVGGAVREAQGVHDQRIGKQGTRHLFRFDGGLERQIHAEILHADQDAVAALIHDRQASLSHLRSLVTQTVEAAPGPVQVGSLGDENSAATIADMAAHYLDGFERREPVFPYLAGEPR